jgi:hypothetical protein
VVAITPDSTEILAAFAARYAVGYPLLSDIGGVVVERYGLLNTNIPPNPRQAPGLPFPGQFLLAPDHTVVAKAFTGDLRHRASGTVLVFETFGAEGEPVVTYETDELRVALRTSTGRLYGGQELAVGVTVEIRDGWHAYASGVPEPYVPLTFDFDPAGTLLSSRTIAMPEGEAVRFDALDETLPAHAGTLRFDARLRVRWSPPPSLFPGLEDAVARRAVAPGRYRVPVELRFQLCRDDVCLAPATAVFELPLEIAAHVPGASAPAASEGQR